MIDTTALTRSRIQDPGAIGRAWRNRTPGVWPGDGRLLIVAADHPARGALFVRGELRMASRFDLLDRLVTALARRGVSWRPSPHPTSSTTSSCSAPSGSSICSMNRGGLQGASFELDDRFTGGDADTIAALGLDGGKMLTRICLADPGSAATLEASGRAVTALAAHAKMALVEPFLTARRDARRVENLLDPDSVITSIAVASALGATSAHTWLKIPVVDDMERVLDVTARPTLLLGGDPSGSPDITYAAWQAALAIPPAAGLVVGRALLYPLDDDVAAAVDIAVSLVTEVRTDTGRDNTEWVRLAGGPPRAPAETDITDGVAGSTPVCSSRPWRRAPPRSIESGFREAIVVPSGGAVSVESARAGVVDRATLAGRESVSSGPSDTAYVPTGSTLTLTGAGEGEVRVAVCLAADATGTEPPGFSVTSPPTRCPSSCVAPGSPPVRCATSGSPECWTRIG